MPLTLINCAASKNAIKILFSHPVEETSATTIGNYSVSCPSIGPTPIVPSAVALDPLTRTFVTLTFPASVAFRSGDTITVTVSDVVPKDPQQSGFEGGSADITGRVRDRSRIGKIVKDVEDAIAYPILTEEVGYSPSPLAGSGGQAAPGTAGGGTLGQMAARAVNDVLGWKANATDTKGFLGALNQSFALTEVEGHIESTWTPRTYAVQTDLAGGITGAQASLYSRAKDALDQCLPLLDGLYPLDPEADAEYVKALREMAKSQMNEILKQLGSIGGPSVLRVETYFKILLGVTRISPPVVDADKLDAKSTLGSLRDTFGIGFVGNQFSNSVDDEQDITNFRIIVDYMLSLWQSWLNNRPYFLLGQGNGQAFFGTQLVLISRQFSVIAETVSEVRFALDSVFVGPSERQTLLLQFADANTPPMFLEDVLQEIESFSTEEGPRLIRDGGRIAVNNNLLPVTQSLLNLVEQSRNPFNVDALPPGFNTARVRNAIDDLRDQIIELVSLIEPVGRDVPPPEGPSASSFPPGGGPPRGGLLLLPPTLDFGPVQSGSKVTKEITLLNTAPTKISNLRVKSVGDRDFVVGSLSTTLDPNSATALAVTFSPNTNKKDYQNQLTITADQQEIAGLLHGSLDESSASRTHKFKIASVGGGHARR
ncbi:MAG: Ig-like domain-containing protein [Candidatus Angelobacter sp.]